MGNQRKLERRNTALLLSREEKRGSVEFEEKERQQEAGEGQEFGRTAEESLWSEYWDEEVRAFRSHLDMFKEIVESELKLEAVGSFLYPRLPFISLKPFP